MRNHALTIACLTSALAACGGDVEPQATPTTQPTSQPAAAPVRVADPSKTPAQIEQIDPRTVRLDGRFEVRGTGTREDPYQVTWQLMQSAQEGFKPQDPSATIPARIDLLNGSWIELSGYIAAPLVIDQTSEVLLMLKRWDGCCIGLPPTAFESVETTLEKPIAWTGQHVIRYGKVRGRLAVDPFVVGGILMGLYRLEQASIEGMQ